MECIPGRFGSYCQFYCSLGCKDIMCDKVSGECVDGCRHGFYPKEGECASCPEHCNRCSDDLQCTDCASGYYGTYCQNTCHVSCLNKVCHKQLGYCTEGCSNGYFQDGQSCSLCPARCTLCRDKSTCTGCLSGYWGQMCQYECPLDCYVCTVSGQCIYGKCMQEQLSDGLLIVYSAPSCDSQPISLHRNLNVWPAVSHILSICVKSLSKSVKLSMRPFSKDQGENIAALVPT